MRVNEAILLITMIYLTGCGVISNNFYDVDNKHDTPQAYRSAQLSGEDLEEAIDSKKIDVVINLRGHKPDKEWYCQEAFVCKKRAVEHHSVKMSASKAPTRARLLYLVEVLEQAREQNKTVLIHCMAGADRTSFGSAVARIVLYDVPAQEALSSFSLGYGHVCVNGCALDGIIEDYSAHQDKMDFKTWVAEMYQEPQKK